ncbi:MAG: xanthine dehydrogenase family protein molybdopterin-binding subunit, partial [Dehalococcoidia bacterium]|nr:xanthine dehydrogenase family protein molybdopterin-binding subunit [Dehalococcoidia bacterium]
MAEYSVVGKSLPRIEGPAKATGVTRFSGDISLPRQLWGRVLGSPHAHARLLDVDTRRAEKLTGVKAIITGKDTLGKWGYTPEMVDQYPLALEKVRYIGEAVAAVAAVDEDTAQEALDLIRVEYEPLPAVFDFLEAMKPGAPQVHDVERNIAKTLQEHFGDVDQAFPGAFYERTDVFVTQALVNGTLEPHAAVASPGDEGRLTLWASTQAPFKLRRYVAEALGMEEGLLRVIKPAVGGGFCGKSVMFCTDYCSSLLSLKTGRPVRLALNREEVFYHGGGRMPMVIEMRMGVDRDGRFVAIDYKLIAENGAYNRNSLTPMILAGSLMHLPYRLPNSRYEGNLVYTNNPPTGVQRGAGNPQIRFAVETQMDMIAGELGLDPMEIRLRNSLQPGDVTPNRLNVRSCALRECIKQACASHGWNDGRSERAEFRGKGLACGDHSVSGRG